MMLIFWQTRQFLVLERGGGGDLRIVSGSKKWALFILHPLLSGKRSEIESENNKLQAGISQGLRKWRTRTNIKIACFQWKWEFSM